jgi:hypothetical protein
VTAAAVTAAAVTAAAVEAPGTCAPGTLRSHLLATATFCNNPVVVASDTMANNSDLSAAFPQATADFGDGSPGLAEEPTTVISSIFVGDTRGQAATPFVPPAPAGNGPERHPAAGAGAAAAAAADPEATAALSETEVQLLGDLFGGLRADGSTTTAAAAVDHSLVPVPASLAHVPPAILAWVSAAAFEDTPSATAAFLAVTQGIMPPDEDEASLGTACADSVCLIFFFFVFFFQPPYTGRV